MVSPGDRSSPNDKEAHPMNINSYGSGDTGRRANTIGKLAMRGLTALVLAGTASLGLASVTAQPASAAVLKQPEIGCNNRIDGKVNVYHGVLGSEAAGDGGYVILLYRWTAAGWQMIDSASSYVAPNLFSLAGANMASFAKPSGYYYGAYVNQVSGNFQSGWRWTGYCRMP
jgi:hypothetical protein